MPEFVAEQYFSRTESPVLAEASIPGLDPQRFCGALTTHYRASRRKAGVGVRLVEKRPVEGRFSTTLPLGP